MGVSYQDRRRRAAARLSFAVQHMAQMEPDKCPRIQHKDQPAETITALRQFLRYFPECREEA